MWFGWFDTTWHFYGLMSVCGVRPLSIRFTMRVRGRDIVPTLGRTRVEGDMSSAHEHRDAYESTSEDEEEGELDLAGGNSRGKRRKGIPVWRAWDRMHQVVCLSVKYVYTLHPQTFV
jgi:hypothetical protein